MNQTEVIAKLQTIFDDLFLEPVHLTPKNQRQGRAGVGFAHAYFVAAGRGKGVRDSFSRR